MGFSYDYNMINLNSGIGLRFLRDKAGSGALRFTSVAAVYAYRFKLSRKLGIRLGVDAAFVQRHVDFSKLTFTDQLLRGGSTGTVEQLPYQRKTYFDITSGGLFYGKKFWIGYSGHHLNSPNESLLGLNSRVPIMHTVHGGYNIRVNKQNRLQHQSITASFYFKHQYNFDQLDLGLYYTYEPVIFGIWYRGLIVLKRYNPQYLNQDALIFMVGYERWGFRLGYSYDVTISRLVPNGGGSHEIALIYEFATQERKKKTASRLNVPCAKF